MAERFEYSFIVPVYNAEKYISECIESILKQGENCELILVDDGSTDASGQICDMYGKQYSRIQTFHTENKGPSRARNFGLEKASGKYVIFVDSDDYINDNLIKNLECGYAEKNVDLIFFSITKVFPNGRHEPMAEGLKREEIHKKTSKEILKSISGCSKFPASIGGKIIKRDFLINNNIKFKEGIVGEDIDWTLKLMCSINSADVYTGGTYYYRLSPNTRRSHGSIESMQNHLCVIEEWVDKLKEETANNDILPFLSYQYAVFLPFYGAVSRKNRHLYKNRVTNLRFLLKFGKTRKIKLIRLAVTMLGINLTSMLLYQYITKRDRING